MLLETQGQEVKALYLQCPVTFSYRSRVRFICCCTQSENLLPSDNVMKKAYSTEGEIKIETKAALLSLWDFPSNLVFRVSIPLLLVSAHQAGVHGAITHNECYRFLLLPVSGRCCQRFQLPSSVSPLLNQDDRGWSWQEIKATRMNRATSGNLSGCCKNWLLLSCSEC